MLQSSNCLHSTVLEALFKNCVVLRYGKYIREPAGDVIWVFLWISASALLLALFRHCEEFSTIKIDPYRNLVAYSTSLDTTILSCILYIQKPLWSSLKAQSNSLSEHCCFCLSKTSAECFLKKVRVKPFRDFLLSFENHFTLLFLSLHF